MEISGRGDFEYFCRNQARITWLSSNPAAQANLSRVATALSSPTQSAFESGSFFLNFSFANGTPIELQTMLTSSTLPTQNRIYSPFLTAARDAITAAGGIPTLIFIGDLQIGTLVDSAGSQQNLIVWAFFKRAWGGVIRTLSAIPISWQTIGLGTLVANKISMATGAPNTEPVLLSGSGGFIVVDTRP
jgi:hypothetical protein